MRDRSVKARTSHSSRPFIKQDQCLRTPPTQHFLYIVIWFQKSQTSAKNMIEGPVGDMVELSQAKIGFNAPAKLVDFRPIVLKYPEASIIVLICADPRLNPAEILSLDGIAGKWSQSLLLNRNEAKANRPHGIRGSSARRSSCRIYQVACNPTGCAELWNYRCNPSHRLDGNASYTDEIIGSYLLRLWVNTLHRSTLPRVPTLNCSWGQG